MKGPELTAAAVKEAARAARADLVGIAGIGRFDSLPAGEHPRAIFPECRSVIVLGRRVLRGALRGVEEGTNFSSTYGTFGYTWVEDNFLAQTTYETTCWLETQGGEAVRGVHVFADTTAHGLGEQPQWLYTVVFDGRELWGEAPGAGQLGVSVDAWEPYLEPAA